jgi:hypothetical protein
MLEKIFKINEIKNSSLLQLIYYIFVLNSIIYFFSFKIPEICWPHFQSCKEFFNLRSLPFSYDLNYFLVLMYAFLVFGSFYMYKKDYLKALFLLSFIFLIRLYFTFFADYNSGNFNYYDVYMLFIYLFLYKKEVFLRVSFIFFYFLASTIKLDSSFISAKYFTSLYLGAPFFNNIAIVLFSNLVIIMQMVGVWFIFSDNKKLRVLVYTYMAIFHFYSGLIVGYRYIITSIPFLMVLFNEKIFERYNISKELQINKNKNILGACFLIVTLCLQLLPYTIRGDHKLTLEGNNYGFYMFEANYQCKSELVKNGKIILTEYSNDARNRCDPYVYFFKYKHRCIDNSEKISWELTSSINGNPFYKVVNESDMCSLAYKPFTKNDWVKDIDTAKKVGYPKHNYYLDSYLPKNKEIEFVQKEKVVKDNPIQKITEKYMPQIQSFYWAVWFLTIPFLVFQILKKRK